MIRVPLATPDEQESEKQYTNIIINSEVFPLKFVEDVAENSTNSANDLGKELLKASANGDINKIRGLLQQGAPFSADWLGTSPLHLAVQGNHLDVCDILIRAGISNNVKTKVDRTPLHFAACAGHSEIVNLLLICSSEVNCIDLLGMTPLHWAVQNGHKYIVQSLLKYGASKDIKNKFNLKPIDIARQINRSDIIELLGMEYKQVEILEVNNIKNKMDSLEDDDTASLEETNPLDSCSVEIEEDEGEVNMDVLEIGSFDQNSTNSCSYQNSIRILQEHGITMLPADDSNILNSVMESGRSVVLTDVGKEVLNSIKVNESSDITELKSNYIKVSSSDLIPLNTNIIKLQNGNKPAILKPVNANRPVKRIFMKKNKVSRDVYEQKKNNNNIEVVMKQLKEARETIEEYKRKLLIKEAEAELYKMQLKHLKS